MTDWKFRIAQMVLAKQALAEADVENIWEWHLPQLAATEDELKDAELALGCSIDAEHRELLSLANGWQAFCQGEDLLGTADFLGSERFLRGKELIDYLEPEVLDSAGLVREQLLPIAVDSQQITVVVMRVIGGVAVPPLVWFMGYEVDRFDSFSDYFESMIAYTVSEEQTMLSERAPKKSWWRK